MPNKKNVTMIKDAVKEKVSPQPLEEMDIDDKIVDPEGILGEKDSEEDDDEATLDDDEIDPFGDKWEQ